jgi:hypothetical protein
LLRLHSEFIESGHESAVSHQSGETVTTPWSLVSGNAFAGVTLHIYRCCIRSASESYRRLSGRIFPWCVSPPTGAGALRGRALLCGQLK